MDNLNGTPIYNTEEELLRAMPHAGYRGHIPRDYEKEPYGSVHGAFPDELLFDISDMSAVLAILKEQREQGAALDQLWIRSGVKSLHQQRTSMCWMFAVLQAVLAIRAKAGLPYIEPCVASASLPCMGWRDNGGWSTNGTRWVSKNGFNTVEETGTDQVTFPRSLYTEDMKAKAKARVITEWIECSPRSKRHQISLGCHGRPVSVGYNRLGHAICQLAIKEIESGSLGAVLVDNYGDSSWTDQHGMYIMRGDLFVADDAVAPGVVKPTLT